MGLHERFPIGQWIIDRLHEDNTEGFDMFYKTKKPDGLLHPSTHLGGCEIAMCHDLDPDIETLGSTTAQLQTFLTGTLWHAWLQGQWESGDWDGIEARCEQKMGKGLPPGWEGACDLLLGQFGDGKLSEAEWTVIDYKTIKGSGVAFLDLDKPKPDQHLQVSAYYHAAEAMGYRMNPEVCIVHIPVSAAQWSEILPPMEQWMKPLPRNKVFGEMKRRTQVLKSYKAQKEGRDMHVIPDMLPKPLPPEQKIKNRKGKQPEIVEKQDWRVQFCKSPFCQCAQEETTVGYVTEAEAEEIL